MLSKKSRENNYSHKKRLKPKRSNERHLLIDSMIKKSQRLNLSAS